MIQDTQCERTVIGTFLSYGNLFHESRDRLSPECFTDTQCRELYRLICLVADSGCGIDIITVAARAATEGSHLTPADVAEAIFYLASPGADFVTGQVLQPNGGIVIG